MNILPWISIPVGDVLDTLDEIIVTGENGQTEFQEEVREEIIHLICEQFLFAEYDFFPTIELVRQLSSHSIVFQFNVLKKRRQEKETIQYPNRAFLFTLNFCPESQCLNIKKIHECPSILNFLLLGVKRAIKETEEELKKEGSISLDFDSKKMVKITDYHIFHNIRLCPEVKKATVLLGHLGYFYLDCGISDPPIIKRVITEKSEILLTRIQQGDMVWFQNLES